MNQQHKTILRYYDTTILRSSRGFTLVELLVSLGIFVILISIATMTFVNALKTQRAIVSLISVNDNASLTLEQMAREIRTSSDFSSVDGTVVDQISFTNAHGEAVTYRLGAIANSADQQIERVVNNQVIPLTASNVNVSNLHFIVKGVKRGSHTVWPKVTMTMTVGSRSAGVKNIFTIIQTTVSAR